MTRHLPAFARWRYLLLAGGFATALLWPQSHAPEAPLPAPASRPVEFAADVQPLLRKKCLACHGAAQQLSGLRLDDSTAAMAGGYSGAVIVPGKSADSSLIHRLVGAKGLMVMPPAGQKLTPEEVGILRAWIDQGARWPGTGQKAPTVSSATRQSSHWAFQPITRPSVPTIQDGSWARNPIDLFVKARLEKESITPAPEADRRTLLRRVSLDLTGLPPTPEEMAAFLGDTRPDAYDREVDRLLASPHFGEKWARHWLDQVRYADSDGYEKDWFRPHAWRYRHWVIDAINRDLPFDRFSTEQLAGDLLPNATAEQRVATGFHRMSLTNREGGIDQEQFRFETMVDRASTTATVWLGLTAGCAQCHDHKYDPFSQKDYYQLTAFFDGVRDEDIDAPLGGEIGPWLRGRDQHRQKREALLKEYRVPELMPPWEQKMLQASANPGKETNWDLAWDCLLKLTEGGDGERIMRIPRDQRTQREQDILTDHFVRNYHFAVTAKVANNELKLPELDAKLRALGAEYPGLAQAMTVVSEPGERQSFLKVRGDYRTNGIAVKPAAPSVLPSLSAQGRPTRLDLANWLFQPENPLTARVAVNRLWQELFSQGLVRSSDDFGTRGDKPTHPELLDFLASKFRDEGWSRKAVLRLMVTSATYRQSSQARPELRERDPNNGLLARQTRLRLPGELIRDRALSVSGLLATDVGGRSVRPPQPAGVSEIGYGRNSSNWTESAGRDRYRRGLYIEYRRTTPYPLLANFDAPRASLAACRRERSNTALQALNLLNDPVFLEAAQALAFRTLEEQPQANVADRLRVLFTRSLGREPGASEAATLERYYQRQRDTLQQEPEAAALLCGAMVPATAPTGERVEAAAWVGVASVLLNLDEFLTRE